MKLREQTTWLLCNKTGSSSTWNVLSWSLFAHDSTTLVYVGKRVALKAKNWGSTKKKKKQPKNPLSSVKICDSVAKCPVTLESANLLQSPVSCKLTNTILFLSCDSGTESDGFLKINPRLYFCRGWSRGLNLNYPKLDNLTNNPASAVTHQPVFTSPTWDYVPCMFIIVHISIPSHIVAS